MGKVTRSILGVALTLAFASKASANSANWFVLDSNGTSAGVTVVSGGTAGTTLTLQKSAGPSTTDIAVIMRSTVTGTSLKGYTLHLSSPQTSVIDATAASTLNGFAIQTPAQLNLDANAQANLVFNLGESDLFGPGVNPGTDDLMRVVFRIVKPAGFAGPVQVFAAIGANGWDDATGETASFGANTAINVGPGVINTSVGSLPLIEIRNIPEPGTLALLGLGSLALIRRRRKLA